MPHLPMEQAEQTRLLATREGQQKLTDIRQVITTLRSTSPAALYDDPSPNPTTPSQRNILQAIRLCDSELTPTGSYPHLRGQSGSRFVSETGGLRGQGALGNAAGQQIYVPLGSDLTPRQSEFDIAFHGATNAFIEKLIREEWLQRSQLPQNDPQYIPRDFIRSYGTPQLFNFNKNIDLKSPQAHWAEYVGKHILCPNSCAIILVEFPPGAGATPVLGSAHVFNIHRGCEEQIFVVDAYNAHLYSLPGPPANVPIRADGFGQISKATFQEFFTYFPAQQGEITISFFLLPVQVEYINREALKTPAGRHDLGTQLLLNPAPEQRLNDYEKQFIPSDLGGTAPPLNITGGASRSLWRHSTKFRRTKYKKYLLKNFKTKQYKKSNKKKSKKNKKSNKKKSKKNKKSNKKKSKKNKKSNKKKSKKNKKSNKKKFL